MHAKDAGTHVATSVMRDDGATRRARFARSSGRARLLLTRILLLLSFALAPSLARADEDAPSEAMDPASLFRGATEALAGERPTEAIAKFEALADRGIVDAVASFNRGLAYSARVRAGAEQPGDLGRAAHGFEETRELTHDPNLASDATNALATVRSEIARRRSRSGESIEIEHGFSLGRAIVELLPENAWAWLAVVLAVVLSIAIVVRRFVELPRAKVAATTSAALSGGLLVIVALLVWAARDARLNLREGIIIAPSARLLDARHLTLDSVAPLPEGVRARIVEEGGGFSRVVIGNAAGYLPSSFVLPLAKR